MDRFLSFSLVFMIEFSCVSFGQNNIQPHLNNLNSGRSSMINGNNVDVNPAQSHNIVDNVPNYQVTGNKTNSLESICHLHPDNENIYLEVLKLKQDNVKLIEYTFSFPEYQNNPLTDGMGQNYKSNVWQRVFDEHGRTLLALKFTYDVLSLSLLTFGVEEMDVPVIYAPPR